MGDGRDVISNELGFVNHAIETDVGVVCCVSGEGKGLEEVSHRQKKKSYGLRKLSDKLTCRSGTFAAIGPCGWITCHPIYGL